MCLSNCFLALPWLIIDVRKKNRIILQIAFQDSCVRVFFSHKAIWLKSDLYLHYHIEDLINPHYW